MHRLAAYLWTSPNTLLGLLLAAPDLVTRRHVRRVRGVLEIAGPWVGLLLRRGTLLKGGARAITFGHVVLAVSPEALDQSRDHERVHVAQYERWGPLFIAAYLVASLLAWARGGDPYRDNRFEREAFGKTAGP
jgi:hypothetical protein